MTMNTTILINEQMSLQQSLNSIGYTLSMPSAVWTDKLDAIRRLDVSLLILQFQAQTILKTEGIHMAGNEIDVNIKMGLCSAVDGLIAAIILQTNENRSQVVSEACKTIETMCEVLGQKIESTAGDIFLSIFEKAAAGNQVFFLSGL